jgi:hypothetical protein
LLYFCKQNKNSEKPTIISTARNKVMKKKLEAELISIAHRVLKLKNRSETKQLQEEAKKLYEQLTILRFYEENFETVKEEIPVEVLEAKLQEEAAVDLEVQEEPILKEEQTFEPEVEEEMVEEVETMQHEDDSKQEQPALFDNVSINDYKDLDFVKVEDVPKEVEQVAETTFEKVEEAEEFVAEEEVIEAVEAVKKDVKEEIVVEKVPEVVFEEPKVKSLNDRLNNGINIGLNDRIAFEKKLFGGSADDFNRVLSQLNTFESFDEAKGFIEDFVKPDYDNWNGKEEFETRFLEFVEKKFN